MFHGSHLAWLKATCLPLAIALLGDLVLLLRARALLKALLFLGGTCAGDLSVSAMSGTTMPKQQQLA
jgi:hypothetical protein